MKFLVVAGGCLALVCAAARADSWSPYEPSLDVAENEKHFLVLGPYDYETHRTAFAFHARGVGTKPPRVVESERTEEASVVVDPGDRLLRKGTLEQTPLGAWMLSATPRAVLFEEYGSIGSGTTLALLGSDGKVKWRHALADFKFDMKKFRRSTSSIWWYDGWWVDEARGRIVIAAKGRQVREVELETGKIHDVGESVLLDALNSSSIRVRRSVLALCHLADEKPKGWVKRVVAFRDDTRQPIALRLEAAWAVRAEVDDPGSLALYRKAKERLADQEVRECFLWYAPSSFAAEDSVALLAALLRAHPDWRARDVAATIAGLGGPGIDELDEIACDDKLSSQLRLAALFGLGNSRSEYGSAAFAFAVRDTNEKFVAAALKQLDGQVIPPLDRALAKSLFHAGAGDAAIAKYLGEHPSESSIAGLEAAAKRAKPDSDAHAAIAAALKNCRKYR